MNERMYSKEQERERERKKKPSISNSRIISFSSRTSIEELIYFPPEPATAFCFPLGQLCATALVTVPCIHDEIEYGFYSRPLNYVYAHFTVNLLAPRFRLSSAGAAHSFGYYVIMMFTTYDPTLDPKFISQSRRKFQSQPSIM